jgi:hypothetical protein
MKKIFLAACFTCASFTSFGYSCANPQSQYQVMFLNLVPYGPYYTCGYTNGDPASICYGQAHGDPNFSQATDCQTLPEAPINSGLIFLLVAGAGLGAYVLNKQKNVTIA